MSSLPGPILVVSDQPDRKLVNALAGAGASAVLESTLAEPRRPSVNAGRPL